MSTKKAQPQSEKSTYLQRRVAALSPDQAQQEEFIAQSAKLQLGADILENQKARNSAAKNLAKLLVADPFQPTEVLKAEDHLSFIEDTLSRLEAMKEQFSDLTD